MNEHAVCGPLLPLSPKPNNHFARSVELGGTLGAKRAHTRLIPRLIRRKTIAYALIILFRCLCGFREESQRLNRWEESQQNEGHGARRRISVWKTRLV